MLTLLLAAAAASEGPGKVKPALTVGVAELFAVPPAHLGFYVLASIDLLIPLNPNWTLIPSNGFEFAPENGNWGGYSFLIFDRVIAEAGDTIYTLEPQVGVVHNAAPRLEGGFDHAFYPTVGLGVAAITPHGTWIPTLTGSIGLKGEGFSGGVLLQYSVVIP